MKVILKIIFFSDLGAHTQNNLRRPIAMVNFLKRHCEIMKQLKVKHVLQFTVFNYINSLHYFNYINFIHYY